MDLREEELVVGACEAQRLGGVSTRASCTMVAILDNNPPPAGAALSCLRIALASVRSVITMNWQLAADAAVAKPKPSRRSRFSVFGGGNASKGEHMHVVQSFEDGSTTEYFTVKGSSIFSQPVMLRSMTCAFLGQMYYIANMMRPDKGIDTLNNFYFEVLGNCLSLLLVFKSNTAYSRFWEARGWVGTLCNATRSFMRRLLFTGRLRPGDGELARISLDTHTTRGARTGQETGVRTGETQGPGRRLAVTSDDVHLHGSIDRSSRDACRPILTQVFRLRR